LLEFGFHLIEAQAKGGTTAAIDPVKLVLLGAVNDREQISADSVRDRLHQTKRGIRGDRGINRAPPAPQNVNAYLRGEWHARANHAVSRDYFRTGCPVLASNAVDLAVERQDVSEKDRRDGESKILA